MNWWTNSVLMVSGGQPRSSATHIHKSILPQTPLSSRLPRDIELSSLCWTAGPCWFSMLNPAVCPCPSQIPWLSLPPSFPPGNHKVIAECWAEFRVLDSRSFLLLHFKYRCTHNSFALAAFASINWLTFISPLSAPLSTLQQFESPLLIPPLSKSRHILERKRCVRLKQH